MSDLKYKTIEELELEAKECKHLIGKYTGLINNQNTRLDWINRYIREKSDTNVRAIKALEKEILIIESTLTNNKTISGLYEGCNRLSYLKIILDLAKKGIKK